MGADAKSFHYVRITSSRLVVTGSLSSRIVDAMNALESPLERLNYYNGQRLEAGDMRTEQDYHVRVRRWLNKSLYTPGIAAGLDVTVKEGDPHTVVGASRVGAGSGRAGDHRRRRTGCASDGAGPARSGLRCSAIIS